MSRGNTTYSSSGIGFCGLLAVLFIGLKLTHYIDWGWWWVLCPLWIVPAVLFVILLIAAIVTIVIAIFK